MARDQRRSGSRSDRGRSGDGGGSSRRTRQGNDDGDDLRTQVRELILDKVREDPYPSTTHLDMVEGLLDDDDEGTESYADALMDKVRNDAFPSIDHLKRLINLA
jgi:hypothetical protein